MKMKLSKGHALLSILVINIVLMCCYLFYVHVVRLRDRPMPDDSIVTSNRELVDLRIPNDPIDYSKRELVDLLKEPWECGDRNCF
ncbi:hypothetical protein DPMN_062146 [Dreissena polymorpha]|uniref:Uncharacterized protein n=1 Tax=Dreissena polymorpha TaxID=45954 RepID=A0A9D4HHI9_DREPO|nr:hypothetical protein DPMN_062146 [Dreissena polymorpha]